MILQYMWGARLECVCVGMHTPWAAPVRKLGQTHWVLLIFQLPAAGQLAMTLSGHTVPTAG